MDNTGLAHTRVMCFVATAKPDEAKHFYAEVLGLEFLSADGFAMMFSVNTTLLLRIQKVPEFKPQQFTVFGWQVDSIDETLTDLSERGVTFEIFGFPGQDDRGICTFPNGDKVAWFKDPDGNTLSIAQIVGA